MNIEKLRVDELGQKLSLTITKEDYAEPVKKMLGEQRKKAEFKGFRKGMVPMTMIKKIYGEQVLGEAINNLISDALNNYIEENKLSILGEPLSSEDQEAIDWVEGNDFVFKFDLAISPKIDFELTEEDKMINYQINISEEAKKEMKENLLKQFGSLQEGEKAKEEDYVVVDLDNSEGCKVEGTYISIRNVAGADKEKFIGAKAGDVIELNVNEAFTNETDRSSMLNIKKDELSNINPNFKINIVNVKTFVPAEANVDTFNKIFGEGKVKNEEEFDKAIEEKLKENYKQEADFRLSKDLKEYIIAKQEVKLPEEFLKRWLLTINKGKFTEEDINKEFSAFLENYRWQLIRAYLMNKFELKIEEKDILEAAEQMVRYQYAMYGMNDLPVDMIKKSVEQVLQDKRQLTNIAEHVEEQKVLEVAKTKISIQNKKIDLDKFRAL